MQDKTELHASIGAMIQAAQTSDTDEARSELFDRYMGEPYGDEVKGRSSYIDSTIRDSVEALLPDLMDVFTSAESMVEFVPVGPEDEEAAKQETEVTNNVFWQQNNGYLILYTWIKEALMQQNSYVKSGWREKTRVEIEEYEGLTPEDLNAVASKIEGEFEVLKLEGFDQQTGPVKDPQTGQPMPINVSLRITTMEKRYVIECVPQEEMFLTPRWHSLNLDGIPCVGHRSEMERGELLAMGFSEESVARAKPDHDDEQDERRHDTKYHDSDYDGSEGDRSTQLVTVYESYVRADMNGDGRAELLQVWSTGDGSTILEWEDGSEAIKEVTGQPFSCLTPFIVPHRHVGISLAEKVDPIQRVNTVLMRHTLDNVYLSNYARPAFDENLAGENTYNDLASPAPGAPIRTGGAAIEWTRPPSVIDTTLPIMSKFDDIKEVRTGATRYNQGLDANSLNKTATGIEKIMDASMKKRLLVARTFAETGIADLFRRIHRDLRSGPFKQMAMRIRNQWVAVDPRTWRHRTDMTVAVGMGSGDRDKKREGLMLMGQLHREMLGAQMPLVNMQHVYALAEKVMETYGFESIEPFMLDPSQIPPKDPSQEKPDPQERLVQAQLESLQAQTQISQMKAETAQLELQMKQQAQQAELAAEAQKAQQEYELKMAEITQRGQTAMATLELNQNKAVMEDDFKRDKLEVDAATGFHRNTQASVNSAPPLSYEGVLNG